jgi:hypothetical protein
MQAGSFGLVASSIVIVALAVALAITFVAPLIAVGIFVVAFGAFLAWRAKWRTKATLSSRHPSRVPRTQETAADPVGDSGIADAARARTDARTGSGRT